jgi:uncharacterized repeat protein (TIGR01451 family)
MKNINKNSIIVAVLVVFVGLIMVFIFGGLGSNMLGKNQAAAAILPTLVESANYSVLGGASITNTGPTSATGAVGVSPGTSIGGGITAGGGEHSNDSSAIAAQTDATNLYNSLNQTCDFGPVGPTDLAGATLVPGVYCYSSSVQISVGGTLTLDAQGDPNAVWIFKTGSTLTTISGASVVFLGGVGQPCNVFWQVGSSATLGTTTAFIGTIVAAHDISLLTGATVNGRILARGVSSDGTVALDTNTISGPTCTPPITTATLTLVKTISGGARTVTDFPLTATGPTTITGVSGAGTITNATVNTGTYTLSETIQSDYAPGIWSCTNGITVNGSNQITLNSGNTTTCTITNTFIPATLTLTKTVINIGGGTKTADDFQAKIDDVNVPWITPQTLSTGLHTASEVSLSDYTASVWGGGCAADGTITLVPGVNACTITNTYVAPVSSGGGGSYTLIVPPLIDLVKVPSPLALPAGPGPVTYTYKLRNIGTVPMTNVTLVDDSCSPTVFVSGDTNADTKLDTNETWTYDCFKTLSATSTNIATATGWANGISATDIANATVVVGVPIVPPLIHVTKVPNPLLLSIVGGMVTYTNKVTNPGTVPLSNVRLTDDKCGPVNYISGDTNGNSKLDINEVWTYTCQTNLTKTTTNTITASGDANGLTAKDFAITTVVVSIVPGLPKTGFPPEEKNVYLK